MKEKHSIGVFFQKNIGVSKAEIINLNLFLKINNNKCQGQLLEKKIAYWSMAYEEAKRLFRVWLMGKVK